MYLYGSGFRNIQITRIDSKQTDVWSELYFVDETLVQIEGKDYWLWVAYEPALNMCLLMHLSRERTLFVCYRFFKQLQRGDMAASQYYSRMEHIGIVVHMQMVEA